MTTPPASPQAAQPPPLAQGRLGRGDAGRAELGTSHVSRASGCSALRGPHPALRATFPVRGEGISLRPREARPAPPCGARKMLRAYAYPPVFRPLRKLRLCLICHRQRKAALPPCRNCRLRACFTTARQRRGCGKSVPPSSAAGSGGALFPLGKGARGRIATPVCALARNDRGERTTPPARLICRRQREAALPPCRNCRLRACFTTARQRRGCGKSVPPSSAAGSGGALFPLAQGRLGRGDEMAAGKDCLDKTTIMRYSTVVLKRQLQARKPFSFSFALALSF